MANELEEIDYEIFIYCTPIVDTRLVPEDPILVKLQKERGILPPDDEEETPKLVKFQEERGILPADDEEEAPKLVKFQEETGILPADDEEEGPKLVKLEKEKGILPADDEEEGPKIVKLQKEKGILPADDEEEGPKESLVPELETQKSMGASAEKSVDVDLDHGQPPRLSPQRTAEQKIRKADSQNSGRQDMKRLKQVHGEDEKE